MPASPRTHAAQEPSISARQSPIRSAGSHQPDEQLMVPVLSMQQVFGNHALQRMLEPQLQRMCAGCEEVVSPAAAPPAFTGSLPSQIKTGVETLSGIAMDSVKVHYNSQEPERVQALAYTQGRDIHIAPGQEQHLPHEAWHVVQQQQGRVRPTMQLAGMAVNDDSSLEKEADAMGTIALTGGGVSEGHELAMHHVLAPALQRTIQRVCTRKGCKDPDSHNTGDHDFHVYHSQHDEWREIDGKYVKVEGAHEAGISAEELYRDSPYLHGATSYGEKRTAQALRWKSTLEYAYLKSRGENPVEVQNALFENAITVAANKTKGNTGLTDLYQGRTAREGLKTIYEEIKDRDASELGDPREPGLGPRIVRHRDKLKKYILADSIRPEYSEIAEALDRPVSVASSGPQGFHAERRIAMDLKENFKKAITRGVKRPCAVCYIDLYSDPSTDTPPGYFPEHSGAWWPSKDAMKGYDLAKPEHQEKFTRTRPSSASRPKGGGDITFSYDTESDSDVD